MITFIAASTYTKTAPHYLMGTPTMPVPTGAAAGDVLLMCAHLPIAEFDAERGRGRFYQVLAEGWQVLEVVEFRDGDNKSTFLTAVRTLHSVPSELSFAIQREVVSVPTAADELTLAISVVCYRGIDTTNPVQAVVTSRDPEDAPTLVITRTTAAIVSATVGTNITDGLTLRSSVGSIRVSEGSVATQGRTSPYTLTTDSDNIGRVLVALTPFVAAPNTDPQPTSGTGVGRLISVVNPLIGVGYRVNVGEFVPVNTPRLLAVDAAFDAIGCCVGGVATFAADPFWQPYTRLLKISYSDVNPTPRLWFAGIATTTTEVDGLFDVELIPLSDLWLDDAVGLDDYPQHITITETLNLNSGLVVDRLAGTIDEWQTWRTYLKKRFEGIPEVAFGVGAEGRYIQGRPQDASPLTLDAREFNDPEPKGISLTPYITSWFGTPDDPTLAVSSSASRADVPSLAPRRVESAAEDGAGFAAPEGFGLPYYEPSSYVINIPDQLAIPPIRVEHLPNGEAQYVAGSRIKIAVDSGGGASLVSSIRTRTVPFPGERKRDRLGRFV